ncbi:MAG: hypothetical protein H8E55_45910 [Pelagibacterales bacterium]|nr:hypothetical protein [Pelagibacterales bacterium]
MNIATITFLTWEISMYLDFFSMLAMSNGIKDFIEKRNADSIENNGVLVEYKKDVMNVNEQLALLPGKVFDSETNLPLNKQNSLSYTFEAHLNAHNKGTARARIRVKKDLTNKLEEYKKIFKVNSLDDLINKLKLEARRYIGASTQIKYGKGLMGAIYSVDVMRGRYIYPNEWDTNAKLLKIREDYASRFSKLPKPVRQIATIIYLQEMSQVKDNSGNLRLDVLPLYISKDPQKSLLDAFTLKAYFSEYTTELNRTENIDENLKCQ